MRDSDKMMRFLEDYETHVRHVLKPTNDEIKNMLNEWKNPSYWVHHVKASKLPTPSPVQRTRVRIKRPESVVDKILRKPDSYPDGFSIKSINKMNDAVGGRIIVYFLSNLPLIDHELRKSKLLEISKEDPPIAYLSKDLIGRLGLTDIKIGIKDSGYASVHYIVRLRSSNVDNEKRPWFELQVRTLAEDIWGEIEHILGYKPGKRTSFAVRKQFQIISAQLQSIDEHFNLLFEELSRFQEEVKYRNEDPLNAENLPSVLSDIGIGCAQREIDGLLKLLASRGLNTVGILQEEATVKRLDIIRNTHRKIEGDSPTNFEIIAGIAAVKGIKEESNIVESIKNQINFLKAWENLRREFDNNT